MTWPFAGIDDRRAPCFMDFLATVGLVGSQVWFMENKYRKNTTMIAIFRVLFWGIAQKTINSTSPPILCGKDSPDEQRVSYL